MLRSVHEPPIFHIRDHAEYILDDADFLSEREVYDESLCFELLAAPIKLSEGVFRARIYTAGARPAVLAISFHHLVLDGLSQTIVHRDLCRILEVERAGQTSSLTPYSESAIAYNAIAHHVRGLQLEPLAPVANYVAFPFALTNGGPSHGGLVNFRIPDETITTLERVAASCGLTLNALFLGTLAGRVHKRSGMSDFSIAQVYLGRALNEMGAVGSYSTAVPMHFSFGEGRTFLAACKHALAETMQTIDSITKGLVGPMLERPSLLYELTDLRPLPHPGLDHPPPEVVEEMTVQINRFVDGYVLCVVYDTGKYKSECIEAFLHEWIDSLPEVEYNMHGMT